MLGFLLTAFLFTVSPQVASAPAKLHVKVQAEDTTRFIYVKLDSGEYFRSTAIEVHKGEKTYWIEWVDVPPGEYTATAIQVDQMGRIRTQQHLPVKIN